MGKKQIKLKESELEGMIREAVASKLNELLIDREPEEPKEREFHKGDMLTTDEVMEYISNGGSVYSRINSRECDVLTGIGYAERFSAILSGTGNYDNT